MSDLSSSNSRSSGLRPLTPVSAAVAWLDAQLLELAAERVSMLSAAGRVLAADVVSTVDVPRFARAMMDGFALRAIDIAGATPESPITLPIIGVSLPARGWSGELTPGSAVRIATGAPLPVGSDAVLPVEFTTSNETLVQAQRAILLGKHVGRIGEDIAKDTVVLPAGRVLRPQDLGVLSSLGQGEVAVVRRPRVRLVITGNELLPAGSMPVGAQLADANGPMLQALVARDGGVCFYPGLTPDNRAAISTAMHDDAEIIVVSGGSSVGQEDFAPQLLASAGELAIHGVALRPGSPAGLGRIGERLVFLLPGNPVACLCAYDFFVGRAVRALGGRSRDWPHRRVTSPLASEIVSPLGRIDYVRVMLSNGLVQPLAMGGASLLSSTSRASGFMLIGGHCAGYQAGEDVEVFLYD